MSTRHGSLEDYLSSLPELKDHAQKRALYSEFRSREDGPAAYDGKMEFWTRTILDSCKYVDDPYTISLDALQQRFKKDGVSPLCLETVLVEMVKNKMLQHSSEFCKKEGWGGWLFNVLVKKPLLGGADTKENHVVLVAVKERGEQLLQRLRSEKEVVLPLDTLLEEESDLTRSQLEMVLQYLDSIKKAAVFEFKDVHGVKLSKNGQAVNEVDKGIVSMMVTATKMEQQMKKMDLDMQKSMDEVKKCLALKKKQQALLHLKRKKTLEELQLKRMESHKTLRDILDKVEDAKTNKEIMDAYQLGTATLKATTKQYGLSAEKVDSVMIDLAEVLADQEEIDNAFKMGANDIIGDTSELETELDAMMAAEESDEMVKQLNGMKVITPTTSPVANKIRAPAADEASSEEEEEVKSKKQPVLA